MNKKPSPANSLAKYAILRLNNEGHYVWRNNTVGVFDPRTKSYRANVTHRGVADVIGMTRNGIHLELEIKIGRDKQNEYQVGHQEAIEQHGGLYFLVKTEQDVEVAIHDIKRLIEESGI